ncbi:MULTISPECIES: type III CRISPR-associated RAMP protein Csx7 [Nostocales]|uniref:CRISPR-associated RAMP protein n=4 Tax=Nostocales TaxID=1161 RepID=A0A8S9TFU5_9CYAN|nr:CRISPR-associated RAMP protein Csx7 [Tolypothrix bouteillei]KAF3891195.1 CRISPR-associated RAMP protein [Tolypothrix bouteillei VB521301]
MFEIFKNRIEITGILETVTALRISAGRSTEAIGSDLPVIKDALGRPLIPGSSFKGALRSRLESFLRGIDESFAANPALETEWSITQEAMSKFKHELVITRDKPKEKEEKLHQFILNKTDLISFLFGSPWLSSKLQIRDLTVHKPEDNWFGQYQERDGVAIDRDTETAGDGKLYDFQIVPAGTPFDFHAIVENAEEWELGLLTIGLQQFKTEQIPLGGGKSRGLGVVKLQINDVKWIDVRDANDKSKVDPNKVIEYLKKLINSHGDLPCDDSIPLPYVWSEALIHKLREEMEKVKNTVATN